MTCTEGRMWNEHPIQFNSRKPTHTFRDFHVGMFSLAYSYYTIFKHVYVKSVFSIKFVMSKDLLDLCAV